MIWYPARVLPPVGIAAGLILACAHGRGAGESAAVQRPAPPPPSPSTVTSDEIARQPVVSLDQLLAGRIAGVTVTPARGGGISVRISGPTSFSLSNEPLYRSEERRVGKEWGLEVASGDVSRRHGNRR